MRNWNRVSRKAIDLAFFGIQPTYEELKRYRHTNRGGKLHRYPAYLWGIETRCLCYFSSGLGYPAYLWGIETQICQAQTSAYLRVSSLPMRNWNPAWPWPWKKTRCCIQPTYEELKPFSLDECISYMHCIQPTYEELKRAGQAFPLQGRQKYPAYLWGIETEQIN